MKKVTKYLICLVIGAILSFLLMLLAYESGEDILPYIITWIIFSVVIFIPLAICVFIYNFIHAKVANKKSRAKNARKNKPELSENYKNNNANKPTFVPNTNKQEKTTNNKQSEIKPINKYIYIPDIIGEEVLLYKYNDIKFVPTDKTYQIAEQMIDKNDIELNFKIGSGGRIHIEKYDTDIGVVLDRTDMINDWIKRNDLIKCWLSKIGDNENILAVAFYRNEQSHLKYCDTDIIKLTHCYSEDSQMQISCLEKGVKLEFDDNYDLLDYNDFESKNIWVVSHAQSIGKLPKKYANKYIDEGAKAIFLDHVEYDEEKDKETPYVIVYW